MKAILEDRAIEARNVFGMAVGLAQKHEVIADTQRTVCFPETPLEHAWMMCEKIPNRTMRFSGYGLAFTRTFARRMGANPVWFLDITCGHNWLTVPIDNMVDEAREIACHPSRGGEDAAAQADILRLTPFIEQMGKPLGTRKEFWWEREWRHVSDFHFHFADLVVAFAPEKEHDKFEEHLRELKKRGRLPSLVDASWGLERMIAALAGVSEPGPVPGVAQAWPTLALTGHVKVSRPPTRPRLRQSSRLAFPAQNACAGGGRRSNSAVRAARDLLHPLRRAAFARANAASCGTKARGRFCPVPGRFR